MPCEIRNGPKSTILKKEQILLILFELGALDVNCLRIYMRMTDSTESTLTTMKSPNLRVP